MLSQSCEYPVVQGPAEYDLADHGAIAELPIAWNGLILLLVTAFSSYVL